MKQKYNLLLLIACFAHSAHADKVYTWVDDNGVAHFSQDKPKGVNAKQVQFVAPPPVDELPAASTVQTSNDDNKSDEMISGNWITSPSTLRKSTLILKPNRQFSYQSLNDPKNSVDLIGTWHYEEGFLQLQVNKKIVLKRGKKSESYENEPIDVQVLQLTNNKMSIMIDDQNIDLARF
ncbi:DUF4124 domain-containing protein [Motilimonas eburnea]|uniref:DUF4124 domain-containing protein n=1 Tax=Motilimonas eburnea TaxID=1737488 RepID=UPI001E4E0F94|nr:DUF4124 domain-containing protein [Motilimonas eburnea]MCE2570795.1 DUF4124 domain-containing protein [Motilimonas eburnea]